MWTYLLQSFGISNVYQNITWAGLSFRETNLHYKLGDSL